MTPRARRLWIALVVLLALGGGMVGFLKKKTSELPVYTTGGERLWDGEEIYRPDDAKPFSYPPFFAVPFVPFAWLPETAHRPLWYLLNVAALLWIGLLVRRIGAAMPGRAGTGALFWVMVLALSLRHVLAVFQNQSHDLLILLLMVLCAAAWGRGSRLAAGVYAGLGGACKATPLLFGLPFVMRRRPSLLVGIGLGFFVASLLPDLIAPRDDGKLWLLAWYEIMLSGLSVGGTAAREGVWHPASFLNQSLSGTLYRLTTPVEEGVFLQNAAVVELGEGTRSAVILGLRGLVLALIAWCSWRGRRDPDDPAEQAMRRLGICALVACGMVLLSPMSSKSHFCVLLLPALFCVGDWLQRRGDVILLGLLVVAFVLGTLSTKGLVGREMGETLLAYGGVTWGTFALLLATGHSLFHRGRVDKGA